MDNSVRLKYIQLLGQITFDFNELEDIINIAISELIGIPDGDVSDRITAGETFQGLQRLLNVLFRYRVTNPTQLKRLDDLNRKLDGNSEEIIGVNTERNDLLHSLWSTTELQGQTTAFKWKRAKINLKKYKSEIREIEITDLENLIVKIKDVTQELKQSHER